MKTKDSRLSSPLRHPAMTEPYNIITWVRIEWWQWKWEPDQPAVPSFLPQAITHMGRLSCFPTVPTVRQRMGRRPSRAQNQMGGGKRENTQRGSIGTVNGAWDGVLEVEWTFIYLLGCDRGSSSPGSPVLWWCSGNHFGPEPAFQPYQLFEIEISIISSTHIAFYLK